MNQAEVRRRQVGALSEILMMITIFVIGNLIGDNAVAYVAVAVWICAYVWSLVSGGLSDGLGKLLRRRRNKGQYLNAHRMRKSAILFQMIIGALGSILLLALAQVLAENLMQVKYCTLILRVLSPIVFLRAVTQVLMGYCQGEGLELPIAIVGILRQFLILVFSFLFVGKVESYGVKVSRLLMQENFAGMYSGFSVAIAILLAELLCIVFLALIYRAASMAVKKDRQEGLRSTDSYFDCIRGIWLGRWPVAVVGMLLSIPFLLSAFFLSRSGGEGLLSASYGPFIGKYMVLCGVLMAVIVALVLPSLGKTFTFIRKEDKRFAKTAFGAGFHICMVHGIFFSVFVAIMAPQIAAALGGENVELLQKMLQGGSAVILLGVLCRYFGRFLAAAGKWPPMLCAVLVAVVVCSVFVGITMHSLKDAGILYLIYGSLIGLVLLTILLGMFSFRMMRAKIDWLKVFIIPLGTSCVAGLVGMLLGRVFTPHLGNTMTVFVTLIIASFVHWVLLLLLRSFREQELEVVAGGRIIHNLGQMFRVF